MTRTALVAVAAAVLGGALVFVAQGQPAHAEGPRVVCSQVPQKPGSIDEQYVANFIEEQLTAGRVRFTTVNGVSTVMCAF